MRCMFRRRVTWRVMQHRSEVAFTKGGVLSREQDELMPHLVDSTRIHLPFGLGIEPIKNQISLDLKKKVFGFIPRLDNHLFKELLDQEVRLVVEDGTELGFDDAH